MITSPIRPRERQEQGIAAGGRLAHPRNALRRFTFVRHHSASMASFRPALAEARQPNQPPASRPVNSEPRPCLFDVGFPLSGPQVRIHTSDLNIRARHTSASPYGLGSATKVANPGFSPHARLTRCCGDRLSPPPDFTKIADRPQERAVDGA